MPAALGPFTALHDAAFNGHVHGACLLPSSGARELLEGHQPSVCTGIGNMGPVCPLGQDGMPADDAASSGHVDAARLLLDRGAQLEAATKVRQLFLSHPLYPLGWGWILKQVAGSR